MNTPLAFIDIDGCLNHPGTPECLTPVTIHPSCVANLNRITDATDAKLVLSSSWRHVILGGYMTLHGFGFLLRSHGVTAELVGHTCGDDECDTRGQQIRAWRRANHHTARFVVLDDMDDGISELSLPAVFTRGNIGLTLADAETAIKILRGES